MQRSQEDYKSLINNINGIIFTLDPRGILTFISSQWSDMLGLSIEDSLAKSFELHLHRNDIPAYREYMKLMWSSGEKKSVDFRIMHADRSYKWYSSTGSAVFNDGEIEKYICVAIDITDRKNAEEALLLSEEKFRSFMDTASDLMHILDENGKFTYANVSMCRALGYSMREFADIDFSRICRGRDIGKLFEELEAKGKISCETSFLTMDGDEIIGRETLVAIYRDNKFSGGRGVFHDLTEQREAETRLRMLEKASRMASIGVMAAGITHEINQPLTSINFAATRLVNETGGQKGPFVDLVADKMRIIIGAIKRIDEIIRHMRSFWVRPDQSVEETLDINSAVTSALSIIGNQLVSHGIGTDVSLFEKPILLRGNRGPPGTDSH